jgi:hypothetical protein
MTLTSADAFTLFAAAAAGIILIAVCVGVAVYLVTKRHRRGLHDHPVIFDLKDDEHDD